MSKYQTLVRALFQQGITVIEIPLDMVIGSFSSKDDRLIIINTSKLSSNKGKYLELVAQVRIFNEDFFINFK